MSPIYRFFIANDSSDLLKNAAITYDKTVSLSGSGPLAKVSLAAQPGYFAADILSEISLNDRLVFPEQGYDKCGYDLARAAGYAAVGHVDSIAGFSLSLARTGVYDVFYISGPGTKGNLPPVYKARQCYPIYDDKLTVKYAKENNYKFFRKSLDGKLKFVRDDYDYIMSASLGSYNVILIEKSNDDGKTWSTYFEGYFRKTDCSINTLDRIIEVKLSTLDMYDRLIAGLDNEYNLIALAPEIVQIQMAKNPILQIYSLGESVVSSYSPGGIYWEQECEAISDESELNNTHGFSFKSPRADYRAIIISGEIHYLVIASSISGYDYTFRSLDSQIELRRKSSSNLAELVIGGSVVASKTIMRTAYEKAFTFNTTYAVDAVISKIFYTRVIHDNPNSGTVNVDIKNKTQFGNFHNYKYATPYDLSDLLYIEVSDAISSGPTEFGQRQPGEYYKYPQVPADTGLGPWFPISKTTWGYYAYWLSDPFILDAMQQLLVSEFTLRHAYSLASCLDKLVKEVEPLLVHENAEAYSRFFYGGYNPLSGDSYQLFIAPITNVLEGEYNQPAQKMPITLKNIFEMLEDCFRVYWFLDGNKLRLEHITFFENGGSYYENTAVQLDTTKLMHPRSKKSWSDLENEYEYDLDNEPSRYEFSWADDSSAPFDGYPLEIHANYLKGKTEKIQVNKFSTDVDLMLANPEGFSRDNIALLGASYISEAKAKVNTVRVPVKEKYETFRIDYILQNGYLSFANLVPKYFTRNLPSLDVTVNNEPLQELIYDWGLPEDLQPGKFKKQKISIPIGEDDPDTNKLIGTSVGNGAIEEMKINLPSRVAEITLRHNLEPKNYDTEE